MIIWKQLALFMLVSTVSAGNIVPSMLLSNLLKKLGSLVLSKSRSLFY